MKKIIFLSMLIIAVMASGCSKEKEPNDGIVITPSLTEYNFSAEEGSVTVTFDTAAIVIVFTATDSKGVQLPVLALETPEDERVRYYYFDNDYPFVMMIKASWFQITQKTPSKIVIDVQPNTSGNERWIDIAIGAAKLSGACASIKITQSAE